MVEDPAAVEVPDEVLARAEARVMAGTTGDEISREDQEVPEDPEDPEVQEDQVGLVGQGMTLTRTDFREEMRRD